MKPATLPINAAPKPLSLAAVCSGVLKLDPHTVDVEALRAMLGDASVKSLPALSKVLGVPHNTLKSSWSPAGMPGRAGCYVLWEVLAWWIDRNRRNGQRSALSDPLKARLQEVELQQSELELRKAERSERVALGELIDRASAMIACRQLVAICQEQLLAVPRDFAIRLPMETASELQADLERRLHRVLTYLAEGLERETGDDDEQR